MKRLDVSCPTIHSLYYLYKYVDKLDLSQLASNRVYYSYPIVKTETLTIYYKVSNSKRYLELSKSYLELYKFNIPLGKDPNLINKRVRNALMVKLHKVLNKIDKEKIVDYILFIFKKRIRLVFSDIISCINKSIANKLFKNKRTYKLSDYFLSFCTQFNLDCLIEIKRSLLGVYKVKISGTYTPFYNFVKFFKMSVTGNDGNIFDKFNFILNKKVFKY